VLVSVQVGRFQSSAEMQESHSAENRKSPEASLSYAEHAQQFESNIDKKEIL